MRAAFAPTACRKLLSAACHVELGLRRDRRRGFEVGAAVARQMHDVARPGTGSVRRATIRSILTESPALTRVSTAFAPVGGHRSLSLSGGEECARGLLSRSLT